VDGKDMTDILMAEERLLLIVAYDLGKSDREGFTSLEETVSVALKQGYRVAILSASLYEAHPFIGDRFGADADLLFCDATTLKTMIRANPGVMTLHKGSITGKWNWIDIANINW
ncbi:MAG: DoxX family protein, partial [Lutibacter sp.]|nr:DoxX family protein [Lutibacter sp.]